MTGQQQCVVVEGDSNRRTGRSVLHQTQRSRRSAGGRQAMFNVRQIQPDLARPHRFRPRGGEWLGSKNHRQGIRLSAGKRCDYTAFRTGIRIRTHAIRVVLVVVTVVTQMMMRFRRGASGHQHDDQSDRKSFNPATVRLNRVEVPRRVVKRMVTGATIDGLSSGCQIRGPDFGPQSRRGDQPRRGVERPSEPDALTARPA